MTRKSAPARPWSDFVRPLAIALSAGVVVIGLSAAGLVRGPAAVVVIVLLWVLLPSARTLSRRLAINGAIGLGVWPVLWWFKWPQFGQVGHVAVVIAVLISVVVYRLVRTPRNRRQVLPRVSRSDLIPLGAALFSTWFFLPFYEARSGVTSIAQLMNGFGNDNVGHFDMYSLIRRYGVTGPGWPGAAGGSDFVYAPYPQHFHTLVAMAAELWHGPLLGSVGVETHLFEMGTGLVLSAAIVTLCATIVSAKPLRKRPGLAVIVSAGSVSVLLLGLGADSLRLGFPGFLLAVIGTVIACVLGLGRRRTNTVSLLAIAGMLVLVAHSWSLLTPLAAVPFVAAGLRLPWRSYVHRMRSAIPALVVVLFAISGAAYALVLVYWATSSVGSPESVLGVGVPFATVSLTLPLSIALTIVGIGGAWLAQFPLRSPVGKAPDGERTNRTNSALVSIAIALVAIVEAAGLVVLQLRHSAALNYYQYKFIYGATMILAIMLMVLVAAWMGSGTRSRPTQRISTVLSGIAIAVVAIGIGTYSGVVKVPSPALAALKAPGALFRTNLSAAAASADDSTARLMNAAELMQSWPCPRPIYLAAANGDLPDEQANQWAMAFSGTWTEDAAPINTYMFELHAYPENDVSSVIITKLLTGVSGRCVVVAPDVMAKIDAGVLAQFGHRIKTWD